MSRHQHACTLPAGDIGNGWTLNTGPNARKPLGPQSDAQLQIKHLGEDVMVIQGSKTESNGAQKFSVWTKEHGLHDEAFVQYSPARLKIRSKQDGTWLMNAALYGNNGRFTSPEPGSGDIGYSLTLLKM
jgi:hypothetical protein